MISYPQIYWNPLSFIPETFYAFPFSEQHTTNLWGNFPKRIIHSPPKIISNLPYSKIEPLPRIIEKTNTPNLSTWINLVEKVLLSPIKKVVLARKTTLKLSKSIHPFSLLSHLKNSSPHLQYFLLLYL